LPVLLSWNVAGRVTAQEAQIEALAEREIDVLCLQEITPSTRARWEEALHARGFHVLVSEWPVPPKGSRRLATLVAAREPLQPGPAPELPWPERHLSAVTGGIEIHNLHAPLSSKEERVKVRTLEALHEAVSRDDGVPRIVAGDLNTPQYESREGVIQTFARTRTGNIRAGFDERHDRAELLLIDDLPARGWRDAFRALHGYERRDRSYVIKPPGYGWRLDHVLLSPGLRPVESDYVHEWREAGLSDHSAVWARFEPEA
jgi:exonuclease III